MPLILAGKKHQQFAFVFRLYKSIPRWRLEGVERKNAIKSESGTSERRGSGPTRPARPVRHDPSGTTPSGQPSIQGPSTYFCGHFQDLQQIFFSSSTHQLVMDALPAFFTLARKNNTNIPLKKKNLFLRKFSALKTVLQTLLNRLQIRVFNFGCNFWSNIFLDLLIFRKQDQSCKSAKIWRKNRLSLYFRLDNSSKFNVTYYLLAQRQYRVTFS